MAGIAHRQPIDVVIVDADPGQRRALARLIADGGLDRFQAHVCATPDEALGTGRDMAGAILLADIETIGGPAHIAEMVQRAPRLIATSAAGSLNVALAAVKAGAIDFLPKPIGAKTLIDGLEAAVAAWTNPPESPVRAPGHADAPATVDNADFSGFIGRSPAMREVYRQIRRMAPSRAPVFITGESGTGKEVCAEAIHACGGDANRPFIAINCSAIPKDLMESEIFGHVRGAFTGAAESRPGAAELADGGTLFLDEIAEMDLGLQAKLLRFVQTGSLRRVGGSDQKRVDVRIVSATNRDPFAEVEAGRFRADLFYRLHVLPIHLPPLAGRGDDILVLAAAFLARFAKEEGRGFRGFDDDVAAILRAAPWPGNVRQLQNTIRRIVVLHDGEVVTPAMLPPGPGASALPETRGSPAPAHVMPAARIAPYREQERMIIEAALAAFGGNIPRAAAALEISPSTIYRKRQGWSGPAPAQDTVL